MIPNYKYHFLSAIAFCLTSLGRLAILLIFLSGLLLYPVTEARADSGLFDSGLFSIYEQRLAHNPNGIGKFYMGREIAKVIGYSEALWLERPSREPEEKPSKIIKALNLNPDSVVADIGAGTGYLSFRIAPLLTTGKVVAVDIQPEMIDIIEFLKQENNVNNVETVLATPMDSKLPPESIDLALMVDAYHEFEYPREVMTSINKALKPGGKVILVEYRGENPLIMIKGLHKMTQKQVKKEMQAVGLIWCKTDNFLPQQHFMVFQKLA